MKSRAWERWSLVLHSSLKGSSTQCALVFTHPSPSPGPALFISEIRGEHTQRLRKYLTTVSYGKLWREWWLLSEKDEWKVLFLGGGVLGGQCKPVYTSFEGLCFCFVRGGVFQRFVSLLSKGRVCRRSVEVAHRWAWMFATPSLPCLWFKARRVFQRNQETNQKSDWLPLKIPLVFRVWTDYR